MAETRFGPSKVTKVDVAVTSRAATATGGKLLYRQLLEGANQLGVAGGAVLQSLTGSFRGVPLKHVGSEIGSNQLPVTITVADRFDVLQPWLFQVSPLLRDKGVISVESWTENWQSELRGFHNGVRVDVFTIAAASAKGAPAYQEIAEELRRQGAVWVSVNRAVAGFGSAPGSKRDSRPFHRHYAPMVITALGDFDALAETAEDLRGSLSDSGLVVVSPVMWNAP